MKKKYIYAILIVVLLSLSGFVFQYEVGYVRIGWSLYKPGEFFSGKTRDLALAAQRGNAEKIDRLVKEGVNVNAIGKRGTTPLMWVVALENEKGMRLLLKKGANPNYIPPKGSEFYSSSVTYLLSESNKSNLLKIVLDNGGDPNARNPYENNKTALMVAAESGKLANLKLLLAHGGVVNARDSKGMSALFLAVETGHFEVAYYLLAHGADYRISGITYASLNKSTLLEEVSESQNWLFDENGTYWRSKVFDWFKKRNIEIPKRTWVNEYADKLS